MTDAAKTFPYGITNKIEPTLLMMGYVLIGLCPFINCLLSSHS